MFGTGTDNIYHKDIATVSALGATGEDASCQGEEVRCSVLRTLTRKCPETLEYSKGDVPQAPGGTHLQLTIELREGAGHKEPAPPGVTAETPGIREEEVRSPRQAEPRN